MRGNSGFLRLAVVGWMLVCSASGGPPRPRRMMRETFSSSVQDSVHMSSNTTQDTDMCMNNGKEVLRSTVTCEKKNGCREFETHGECCPTFLCECKLNETIYENGDKIIDPENPCRVCVCRGGDINCNDLKCYSRNDCKNVTYTPGVCCPEYMNCPPLENVELNSSNETTTEYSMDYYSSSTISLLSTPLSTTSSTTVQTSTQLPDIPVGIKIKEITKPEEIRITDDRPNILKTIKSSEVIPTKSSTSLHSTEALIEPDDSHAPLSSLAIISYENTEIQPEIEPEIEQYTTYTFDGNADQPIKLDSTDLNTVGDTSMGPKLVRQTEQGSDDEVHTTISPLSSENEIKDDEVTTKSNHVTEAPVESTSATHNSSVLQVGDSVVIFDRSGQTQSIPLRVAGLQRGEDTEDEERKEGRKPDESMQNSTPGFIETSSTDITSEESPSTQVYETFYYEPKDMATVSLDFPSSEFNTASEEGFIDSVRMNDFKEPVISAEPQSIDTTSEKSLEDIEDSSGYSSLDITDKVMAPSTVYEQILNINDGFEGSSSTSEEIPTTSEYMFSSTVSSHYSLEPTTEDDDIVQHDQNINFPHITDDLSIHGSRMEDRMEEEEKVRVISRIVDGELEKVDINDEQNSIILPEVVSNSSTFDIQSTVAPFETLNETLSFNDVEGRSPGEPLLIPEWERNHTTVAPFEFLAISNETTEDYLLAELSSHSIEPINVDESTTNQSDLSSSTELIETHPSTSESDPNYDVESIETHQTTDQSQVKETNNVNLFLEGTAEFFKMQKKFLESAMA